MMTIGVVGAGVMGADIALLCAAHGMRVVLKDVDQAVLDKFAVELPQKLRGYKMMGCTFTRTAAQMLELVQATLDYAPLADVDWIIESAPENVELKQQVYAELARVCRADTYYAVNTSCIPITKLAAQMPDPSRVLGAHFMNPVPLKKAVEVVRGFHTSDASIEAAKGLLKQLGKNAIVVKDFPGFVANRLSHLFMNEAAFLVQDGVAKPAEIDAIFREGYGHKMGPLETADLIGLDTVLHSLDVLYQHYQDPKFRCCPLLRQMVDAGLHGKKSGRGFYDYNS
ncbi:3-hydroxyacyl-CoA dehydrogenase family protein [Massilia sp. W12]|uniref:3-hydroxyacyl-CoA dehydrogenase family protein n=1 Tax=Massilia sp. W12 TaxID=3126507 RepID=UPI0030CE0470